MKALLCLGFLVVSASARPLDFGAARYSIQEISTRQGALKVRVYERLPYVSQPVDSVIEVMNVFIPEAYFHGGKVGKYSAASAPIFFSNRVGGYLPAEPATIAEQGRLDTGMKDSTVRVALAHGFVVASPGVRGRNSVNSKGIAIGKAPAAIVDLKAAVRYLRWNDSIMPGNAERIVSNGTSAGGALSALLGATGNHNDYVSQLEFLGAAPTRDDIFAVSAYCPITNLDNADMAYEWQFQGVNERYGMSIEMVNNRLVRQPLHDTLSTEQRVVSAQLAKMFPAYVNALALKDSSGTPLALDSMGQGSFMTFVKSFIVASARSAQRQGVDVGKNSWLRFDANNEIRDVDFSAYVESMHRQKLPPAFDALDLSSGENQLFGNTKVDKRHFTAYAVLQGKNRMEQADSSQIKMMNPMRYIGFPGAQVAGHWRIRHGTQDKDTGLAISIILSTLLRNKGYDVDFKLPWDKPHSGDYDLDELFAWIDGKVLSANSR